jgi:prolyl 4-hydroxylase
LELQVFGVGFFGIMFVGIVFLEYTLIQFRYTDSQEFRPHFDWFDPNQPSFDLGPSGNRFSSFFVYLVAKCRGGTTMFPEVPRPSAQEWCDVLKCHNEDGTEVEVLEVEPKVGTAIFWFHLDPESGEGDQRTLHAGMPVINGTKVGLNIFTRERQYRNLPA